MRATSTTSWSLPDVRPSSKVRLRKTITVWKSNVSGLCKVEVVMVTLLEGKLYWTSWESSACATMWLKWQMPKGRYSWRDLVRMSFAWSTWQPRLDSVNSLTEIALSSLSKCLGRSSSIAMWSSTTSPQREKWWHEWYRTWKPVGSCHWQRALTQPSSAGVSRGAYPRNPVRIVSQTKAKPHFSIAKKKPLRMLSKISLLKGSARWPSGWKSYNQLK